MNNNINIHFNQQKIKFYNNEILITTLKEKFIKENIKSTRKDIKHKIFLLENEKNNYYLMNMKILEKYFLNTINITESNQYWINNNIIKNIIDKKEDTLICDFCDNVMNNIEICQSCFSCKQNIIFQSDSSYLSIKKINYIRLQHFRKKLNEIQGKLLNVKEDILKKILDRIVFEKIDLKCLDYYSIKEILKKIKCTRYFYMIYFIFSYFKKIDLTFPNCLIEQILFLFKKLENNFNILFKERKNFLNYDFIIHQLLIHLKKEEYIYLDIKINNREQYNSNLFVFNLCIA